MAQVIVVEDNQTMLDLLTLNLKTFANADVIPRENAAEAIDLLSLLPSVDLIIVKNYIHNENIPHTIVDFLINNRLDIPMIIVGDVQEEYPGIEEITKTVSDTKDWEEIVKLACNILGVSEDFLSKKMSPDYIPMSTRYFLSLESTFCDIFIRIKKGPGDYQFVKRIHQGEKYPTDVVNKFIIQGLKYFYIEKKFEENFTNFISNQLVEKLNNKSINIDNKIEIMSEGHNIALQEIYKMGFTSATIQLAESIVHSMIDTFKVNPEMSPLLFKIINSKTGYLYRHAHMCSIVSSEILKNMGRDKKELHETMAYASFFKDISFVENEELAKISTFNTLEESQLSEFDWDLVFNHAQEAASITRKWEDAPLDVDTIIKNHHGATNGRGFATENNKTDFPKLSLIFIVAVEFTNELLSFKELGRKPRPIVDILKEKYDITKMKDIIHALEKTIKNS